MAKEKKVKNEKRNFMKDFKAELKRVAWPTSKQMVNNVTAVIVIVLITAAIVFCLDFVFVAMNDYGINKLKSHVQANNQEQTQVLDNTNSEQQTDTNSGTENNDVNANNESANTEAQDNNSVDNTAE